MAALDDEIDKLEPELAKARVNEKAAQKAWEDYLKELQL
jgi:hypothetical protein